MRVLLFATLKERAGAGAIDVDVPDEMSVAEFRRAVSFQHPTLAAHLRHAVVSVNHQFAFEEDRVRQHDEVALFPPVSGGAPEAAPATIILLNREPIDLNGLQQAVTTDADGSVVFFLGTVRGKTGDEVTTKLEYECYEAMALAKMRQVADEMRAGFGGIHGIALHQRIGEMQVGEPVIAVVVSAGHRGDGAFEAARYGIDRVKQIVPVWKRETRPDGSAWVEGDYAPVRGD